MCKILDLYKPLTVLELLGFKPKNENDNNSMKNGKNELFALSPTSIHIDLSYHPVVK